MNRPASARSGQSRPADLQGTSRPGRSRRSEAGTPRPTPAPSPRGTGGRHGSLPTITARPRRSRLDARTRPRTASPAAAGGRRRRSATSSPAPPGPHLGVLQRGLTVAVVAFPTELHALQSSLAQRECRGVIGVQIGMNVPFRRLLLLPLVLAPTHDRLVSQRRMPAVSADVVHVQRISGPRIQQPRVVGLALKEQVVVGLHVGSQPPVARYRIESVVKPLVYATSRRLSGLLGLSGLYSDRNLQEIIYLGRSPQFGSGV